MAGEAANINARNFIKGVQNMQLGLQQSDISDVFQVSRSLCLAGDMRLGCILWMAAGWLLLLLQYD
jgi:hypothetical protein